MHSNALSCHSGLARWTKRSRLAHNKTRGSRTTTLRDIIRASDPKWETCDVVRQWQWVSCDGDVVKPGRSDHEATQARKQPQSDRSCVCGTNTETHPASKTEEWCRTRLHSSLLSPLKLQSESISGLHESPLVHLMTQEIILHTCAAEPFKWKHIRRNTSLDWCHCLGI